MNSPTPSPFVWYSTKESRTTGIVSLLAVAETVICVALYWLFWLKWGVTWHHWMIVVATPLVLMRSKASVKKGVAWFDAYWHVRSQESHSYVKRIAFAALSAVFSLCVAWFLARNWLADLTGWPLIWRSAIVGLISLNLGLAVAIARAAEEAGTMARSITRALARTGSLAIAGAGTVAILGLGFAIGIWFRAIMTRAMATFSHPIDGLHSIPTNWRHFVWHLDFLDPPELLPGHYASGFGQFAGDLRNEASRGISEFIMLYLLALPVFYLPALFWRWSIKSTAWFYLPLLWVGRGWQNIHGEELLIWAKGYSRKWINITGVLLAAFLLSVSLVALIVPVDFFDLQKTLRDSGAPLPMIGIVLVLDWQSLAAQPWHWFYLPSWAITLMLFFLIDDHGTDIEKGAKAELRLPVLRRWMWISNARTALTNLGLLIALLYFLKAVDATGQVAALFS
ncbi:hypothetical protein [Pseudophaeobacter sp.]|uniref:hypothetical protein n=1 Tax=Pseudophaeobacter sp. TaxID=1971739 RepID=UPI003299A9EF